MIHPYVSMVVRWFLLRRFLGLFGLPFGVAIRDWT